MMELLRIPRFFDKLFQREWVINGMRLMKLPDKGSALFLDFPDTSELHNINGDLKSLEEIAVF